jgi:hypothetical protein
VQYIVEIKKLTIQKIEKELMKLDANARAKLASALLSSLDDLSDAENEKLWAEEANKRHNDLIKGKAKSRSAESVLKTSRGRLK